MRDAQNASLIFLCTLNKIKTEQQCNNESSNITMSCQHLFNILKKMKNIFFSSEFSF